MPNSNELSHQLQQPKLRSQLLPPLPKFESSKRLEKSWFWDGNAWSEVKSDRSQYEGRTTQRLQYLGENEFRYRPLAPGAKEPPLLWFQAYPSEHLGKKWLVIRSPYVWSEELYKRLGSPQLYYLDGQPIPNLGAVPDLYMMELSEAKEWSKKVLALSGVISKWDHDSEPVERILRTWYKSLSDIPRLIGGENSEEMLVNQQEWNQRYEEWRGYCQQVIESILPFLYTQHPSGAHKWARKIWAQTQDLWKESLLIMESQNQDIKLSAAAYMRAVKRYNSP